MPELPEVETVLRGMEGAMRGRHITHTHVDRRDLRKAIPDNFEKRLDGLHALKVFIRRGKYIIIQVSDAEAMILHLGMSGRVRIYDGGKDYEAVKHDHVTWTLDDGTMIAFNDPRRFGMLWLAPFHEWDALPPFDKMGPEPLSNDFSGGALYERLHSRRTPIKVALLDQRVVSGVGNIYACEALYRAQIDPARRSCDISEDEAAALAGAIRSVLEKAIAAGGSTLKDYQHTDGSLGYFQYSFAVYDREGEACPDCSCDIVQTGGVIRTVQGGRSTYACMKRQK